MLQSCLLRKDFDFLRNSRPTVPLYADRRELLGFRTFLTVCQRAENPFGTLKRCVPKTDAPLFARKQGVSGIVNNE